jgi:hypothetical protein
MIGTKRLTTIKKCLSATLDNVKAKLENSNISIEEKAHREAELKDILETLEDVVILIERYKTDSEDNKSNFERR